MIAGIDFSTHAVDIILLDDDTDTAAWTRFQLTGDDAFRRARSCRKTLPGRSWWEDNGVWLIGLEDPYSQFPRETKTLGYVAGAIAVLLPPDLTVIQMAPQEWKRIFCAKASAKKEEVATAARARCAPADGWPLDATDAYGIAWAVRTLNNEAIQKGRAA
jgi:hypothetical protein